MRRRPPRSTQSRSSAASDVYKRQGYGALTITNFDQGNNTGTFDATEGDQIQLNGLTAPTALQVSYAGGNTILDFGSGDVITLLHVTQGQYEGLAGAEFTSGDNGNNGNNGGNNSGGNSSGPVVNDANNTITYTGTVSYTHLRAHETRHDIVC